MRTRRIATRIALAAMAAAGLAVLIVSAGVFVAGRDAFARMMVAAGDTATHAHEMFDASVTGVLVMAALVAASASVLLAVLLGRMLARPLDDLGQAARRIAKGDYGARVARGGPEEIASLADSFNQMAESVQEQEQVRREFIANAAHELRTPLTNLQGYLEALRDGVLTADQATFQSLWEEADRLVRLAHSLDRLAEGDRGAGTANLVELDLVPALTSALELARPGFEARGIRIERRTPESLPVRADPDHLAQVLANLLQNAARYTAEDGHVTVVAQVLPGSALVSVTNTGDPIPPADLPHLFERFYRAEKSRDRSRGGAGIGLAIVKQLVEAGGGRVGAESTDGRTRIWFSLPAASRRGR
jgi:two-component system, OmpR family, sensor histidine kinase BaeS